MTVTVAREANMPPPAELIKGHTLPTDMQYHLVEINADLATRLLLHNIEPERGSSAEFKPPVEASNRRASPARMELYTRRFLAGEWHVNPQPLVFSEPNAEGKVVMLDGQQRLKALVDADRVKPGITALFVVCLHASLDCMVVLDQGKGRTPTDFLAMRGVAYAAHVSRLLRMYFPYLHFPYQSISLWRSTTSVQLSPEAEFRFLKEHPEVLQAIEVTRGQKSTVPHHVLALAWVLIANEYGPFIAGMFTEGLAKGALNKQGLKTDDPRWKLREFLGARAAAKHKWDGFELLAYLITCANAYLLGSDRYKADRAWSLTAKHFPQLLPRNELPHVPEFTIPELQSSGQAGQLGA